MPLTKSRMGLLMRLGDLRFIPDLASCTCERTTPHHARWGAVSYVMHAERPRAGGDRAVKVYIPGPNRHRVTVPHLREIEKKLNELAEMSGLFATFVLHEQGLCVTPAAPPDAPVVGFDIAIMEWFSDHGRFRLDEFVAAHRHDSRALAGAARALRLAWAELADLGVAHGDLCAANLVICATGDPRRPYRPILLDTDTLSWDDHLVSVRYVYGQNGYFTPGRRNNAEEYVSRCQGAIWMIDVPAQLVIYLSLLGYACERYGSPDVLSAPEDTLAFEAGCLSHQNMLADRLSQLRRLIHRRSPDARAVHGLLDDLRTHCADESGIAVERGSPFRDMVIMQELHEVEDQISLGGNAQPRKHA